MKYPKRTGVTNAQWEGEDEDSEESTVTFGQVEVPARKLMTYVDISNELLADSGGSAEAEVRLALAEDFGAKEGVAFVNGSGAKEPEGIMTNGDVQSYLNGHATIVQPDALIKLMYDLPAAYRSAGSWLMNGTTLGIVRTLKDGDGRYLWQPSFQVGHPRAPRNARASIGPRAYNSAVPLTARVRIWIRADDGCPRLDFCCFLRLPLSKLPHLPLKLLSLLTLAFFHGAVIPLRLYAVLFHDAVRLLNFPIDGILVLLFVPLPHARHVLISLLRLLEAHLPDLFLLSECLDRLAASRHFLTKSLH